MWKSSRHRKKIKMGRIKEGKDKSIKDWARSLTQGMCPKCSKNGATNVRLKR